MVLLKNLHYKKGQNNIHTLLYYVSGFVRSQYGESPIFEILDGRKWMDCPSWYDCGIEIPGKATVVQYTGHLSEIRVTNPSTVSIMTDTTENMYSKSISLM